MAEQISTLTPFRVLDANGDPISGAKATFFQTGTTTAEVVYTDSTLTTAHPSPLLADAQGKFPPIWHSGTPELKVVLTDASDVNLNGSPLDPAPMTSSATIAANISFTPTSGNPANNVQQAIENVSKLDGQVSEKAANFTIITSDFGKVFECTAGFTMSLTAAATLGNGFSFGIIANGGDVVIDPDGSEQIDKADTYTLYDGQQAVIKCDGTKFFITPSGPRIQKFEANGNTSLGFDIPAGVNRFRIEFDNLIIGNTTDQLILRFRKAGELLPAPGAGTYYFQQATQNTNGTVTGSSGTGTSFTISSQVHTGFTGRGGFLVQGVNRTSGIVSVMGSFGAVSSASDNTSGILDGRMFDQAGEYDHFEFRAGVSDTVFSMSGRILWDS